MLGLFARIRRSLRLKLVLLSIGVEIVMLALLLGNSLRLVDGELERHAGAQVEDFRKLLDASLSLTLFQRDHAAMTEMLRKLVTRQDSGLKYVVVLDEQGNIYAQAGAVDPVALPDIDLGLESSRRDGVFDAEGILALESMQVGKVRYGVSLESFIATQQSLLGQGVLIASVEVLLSLLLLVSAGYLLTRHVDKVVAATRHVAAGNYEIRVAKESEDEVGQLADHFNRMAAAIRERIDALHASERQLFEEKEKAWVTLHSIGDGVITTDCEGRVEMLNPIAEQLTGWSQHEARGLPIEEVFVVQDESSRRSKYNPVLHCLRTDRIVDLDDESVLVSRDGKVTPISDSAAPIHAGDEHIIGAVLVFHDMSQSRQMASQLAYQAKHDALTGLVNRAEFERRLQRAVDAAVSDDERHVLCYMDLDQFKLVNDTCGHIAGDELLRQVTTLLKAQVRGSDTLARLGGDEFGVLLERCPMARAVEVAEQLRSVVAETRFAWQDRVFDIGASIGVVAIDQRSGTLAEVLSAADMACYLAKERGRNRVCFHQPGDEESERRQGEMHLVSQITAALEEDRFELFAQQIRPLQNRGSQVHYEVLLRMLDAEGKHLPPGLFIPAAERFHLMHQVDRWVVENTLATMARHRLHDKDAVFSINLSGQTLAREESLDHLIEAIGRSGVPPESLCFEVTETAAISNLAHASVFIKALKRLGASFALDDFGSGLSSFAYLKGLDVDYLKIDGGFVKDMLKQESDAAMVEAINQVGHVMGLQTIAEYVEDQAIMARLARMGVDFGQGYGIHRPVPMRQLVEQLTAATVVEFPRA